MSIKHQNRYSKPEIDLLYILGYGSQWNNNELRYSLRSVQKNLKNFRHIFIIGANPGFLNYQQPTANSQLIYIEHPDEIGPHNADGNITRKIIRACQDPRLSDTFIKMNDDYVIIRPMHVSDIYPMHKGNIPIDKKPNIDNPWRQRLYRTADKLIEKGLPYLHFDYHAPIPINKHEFPKIVSQFNYEEGIGYTTRSMYGNIVYPNAPKLSWQKIKIFNPISLSQINNITHQKQTTNPTDSTNHQCQPPMFLAYNDDGLNRSLRFWLASMFPEPSIYETGNIECPLYYLAKWYFNGQEYNLGVETYHRFYRNRNLIKLFNQNKTPGLERKLYFKLMRKIEEL